MADAKISIWQDFTCQWHSFVSLCVQLRTIHHNQFYRERVRASALALPRAPPQPTRPHLIFEKFVKVPSLFVVTIWFLITLVVILVWSWTHRRYLAIHMLHVEKLWICTPCTPLAKSAEINRFFVCLFVCLFVLTINLIVKLFYRFSA